MGVKVSKTMNFCTPKDDIEPVYVSQTNDNEANGSRVPQFNDNATKPTEREPFSLYSPSDQSMSSQSSINSLQLPLIGSSPLPVLETETIQVNSIWPELKRTKTKGTPRTTYTSASKPPWRPSSIATSRTGVSDLPKLRIIHANRSNYSANPYKHPSRLVSTKPSVITGSMSSSTYSCNYDSRLQTGQAHLRRCTAAQQVQARRPDIWDSLSVDCCLSPTARFLQTGRNVTKVKHRQSTRYIQDRSKLVFKGNDIEDVRNIKQNLISHQMHGSGDVLDPRELHDNCSTIDDRYSLRYVFYVEDKTESMKPFTTGGRVSLLARESACRVYVHTRRTQTIRFDNNPNGHNSASSRRIVEPALFYQGKRVRPVTVAAQNMNDLLQFLDKLNTFYPELEASKLLHQQLEISPFSLITFDEHRDDQ